VGLVGFELFSSDGVWYDVVHYDGDRHRFNRFGSILNSKGYIPVCIVYH
jgi:hypothetical protein